ncbi:MAG: EamA family transporter, partial [Nitrososphaerales archaeon]
LLVVLQVIVFATLAALFFSLQGIANRKAVLDKEVIPGSFLSVAISIPFILPIILWSGEIFTFFSTEPISILLLAIMGVIQYVGGRGLNTLAVKMIGNTRSTPIRETSLIHSVLFGIVLLNERVTLLASLAVVLILFGVMMASMSGEVIPQSRSTNFRSSTLLKGILIGLVGASFWGFAPILIRSALPGVSSPIMATWISFIFGTIAWTVILTGTRKVGGIKRLGKTSIILFLVAGVMTVMAQLFRFSALGLEQVVFVVPLMVGINPIFNLILSAILIRKIEGINKFVIIGILASALGAFGVASGL